MFFAHHAEGVNGILPNLDLVNVVSYLCQSEGIHVVFHTTVSLSQLILFSKSHVKFVEYFARYVE